MGSAASARRRRVWPIASSMMQERRRRAGRRGGVAGPARGRRSRAAASSRATTRTRRRREQAWAGGWFHTGDLVRQGDDGSLFFVDRSKNIIRRSGENIAAVEVESALQAHPDVLASAVCPVPDEIRGEEVFAFVVLRPGRSAVTGRARNVCRPIVTSRLPITKRRDTSAFARRCRRPHRRSSRGPRSRQLAASAAVEAARPSICGILKRRTRLSIGKRVIV